MPVSSSDETNSALHAVMSRHNQEWMFLRKIIKDEANVELREAAALMTPDDRMKRLVEINKGRKNVKGIMHKSLCFLDL